MLNGMHVTIRTCSCIYLGRFGMMPIPRKRQREREGERDPACVRNKKTKQPRAEAGRSSDTPNALVSQPLPAGGLSSKMPPELGRSSTPWTQCDTKLADCWQQL